MLMDPCAVKCTAEIKGVLDPHKKLIADLIISPEQVSVEQAPVIQLITEKSKTLKLQSRTSRVAASIRTYATMFSGGLTDTDLAGINNWFHMTFPDSQHLFSLAMDQYAIGYCRTLLLAHCHHNVFLENVDIASVENIEHFVLYKAWD